MHVVSCYAPTRVASRQEKDTFFDELNTILSSVPAGEKYITLGDINARVRSRQVVGDQWSKVRGPHGCGVTNDAGKERLASLQQETVCNTWFRKEIHITTSQVKAWSCIDYIIMRDRRICSDVTVKGGAECNTHHQFLRASMRMAWRGLKKRAGMNEGKRNDMSGLVNCKDSDDMSTAGRPLQQQYIEEVLERATSAWPEERTVEERWEVMSSALLESLEARKSIREAKNSWFRAKAQEAEGEHFGGKKVWKCIRDMQLGRRGRVPTRVVAICDESGEPCSTPTEQH